MGSVSIKFIFFKNNNDLISFEYFFNLYFDGQKKIRRNL